MRGAGGRCDRGAPRRRLGRPRPGDDAPPRGFPPPPRYLSAERVLDELCRSVSRRRRLLPRPRVLELASLAGGLITAGARVSPGLVEEVAAPRPAGVGPGGSSALPWTLGPVGIGDLLGAPFLVALPVGNALEPADRNGVADRVRAR